MKNDFDDDDHEYEEELDDDLISTEPRDYTGRNVLVVEGDEYRRDLTVGVLKDLLTGAVIRTSEDCDEAYILMQEENFDTYVVDFQTPGVSNSEFVKAVNNDPDAHLVAFTVQNLDSEELKNRFKLEPLRKLFDMDKQRPKTL